MSVTILPVVSSCKPCGESFRHLRYSAHINRFRTRTPRRWRWKSDCAWHRFCTTPKTVMIMA